MVKANIFNLGTNWLVGSFCDYGLVLAVGLLPSVLPIPTPFFMPFVNYLAFKHLG